MPEKISDIHEVLKILYAATNDPEPTVRSAAVAGICTITNLEQDSTSLKLVSDIATSDSDASVRLIGIKSIAQVYAFKNPEDDYPSSKNQTTQNFYAPVYGVSASTEGDVRVQSNSQLLPDIPKTNPNIDSPKIIHAIIFDLQKLMYQNQAMSFREANIIVKDYFKDLREETPYQFDRLQLYIMALGEWEDEAKNRIQEIFQTCICNQVETSNFYQATLDFFEVVSSSAKSS